MPQIGNKHFAYSKAGYKAAARARKRLSKKNYSSDAIKMARRMYG